MEDQQQYQTYFSVPESLESKAMFFFTSSHKMKQSFSVKYSQILELQRISINILIHILLYITPLLDYLVIIDHFSTYFHREQIYIYKQYNFIFQQEPFRYKMNAVPHLINKNVSLVKQS